MVETITLAEYRALQATAKPRSKYGNHRCQMDGISFDSKKERDYYASLRMRELAGEVRDVSVHPEWDIWLNSIKICVVEMDFCFFDKRQNKVCVVDVKGFDNPLSKLKRKLLEAQTGFTVEVVS